MLLILVVGFLIFSCSSTNTHQISSPDGNIKLSFELTPEGRPVYAVYYGEDIVISPSPLGLVLEDTDLSHSLRPAGNAVDSAVQQSYTLSHGKVRDVKVSANVVTIPLKNQDGHELHIRFYLSDDGVAFQYTIPEFGEGIRHIREELSGFAFQSGSRAWLQPRATAKSGWNAVNPSYEEHYWSDTLLSGIAANDSGWVFPALITTGKHWVNITETWPDRNYCGSHLNIGDSPGELIIAFPEPEEGFPGGAVYPESALPWTTPWRVITIGDNPGVIVESTLGTDLARPSALGETGYVKPGRVAWSWALEKDPSVNFERQVQFIDYASRMQWEYCLIDVNWNYTIGWEKLGELSKYAASNNVGLIVWYSSSGSWNTIPFEPRDMLLTSASRHEQFSKLRELGIKGIKVDFFGGDGQSMLNYYLDILEDANQYQLMVNCHGATLPRGIHRTYPNLVTMESVRGFEYATFGQETADRVPVKSTILPFTRNAFDPMDFTPVCFTEYDNNSRVTGNGAELAQAVIFLSGIQHYAETPEGMRTVPGYVKSIMREIPNTWDETRFVDGYPGEYVVIARRSGKQWYVAGINGTDKELSIIPDLGFIPADSVRLITEGETKRSFSQKLLPLDSNIRIELMGNGGFVLKAE